MQSYYNNISTLKKVAFIDNISSENAERISNEYPFAICFTSLDDDPVIWYNGKQYGGRCKVSNKKVLINGIQLGLIINDSNEIELTDETLYFFIGQNYTNTLNNNQIIESNISYLNESYNNLKGSWHILPTKINFNEILDNIINNNNTVNIDNFKLNSSDIIIIPTSYKLSLPMLNESTNSNIDDSIFVQDSESGVIIINNNEYNIYKIRSDFRTDTLYFISIIEKR